MDQFKKTTAFFLFFALILPALFSCSKQKELVLVDRTQASYSIVRPENPTEEELEASKKLFLSISAATGCPELVIKEDWYKRGTDPKEISAQKEILIGQTNRSETTEATLSIKFRDFIIKEIGNKIVITGVTGDKTAEAVNYFINNYVKAGSGKVSVPSGISYVNRSSYDVTEFKIGGVDVTEYKIVYGTDPGSKDKAYALRDLIGDYSGFVLRVVSDSSEKAEREILVGDTNREESGKYYAKESRLDKNKYAIELVGTKLVIASTDKTGNAKACKSILLALNGGGNIDSSINGVVDYTPNTDMTLLNYNIRYNSCNTENVDKIMGLIRENDIDIIGLQEAKSDWINAFKYNLTDYSSIVTYRSGGVADEANPIFYKSSKYTLIESGTFWLSETPEEISIGWDATMRRICTWVVLEDNSTHDQVIVLNSQFDADGAEARAQGAKLICSFIKQKGLPAVFTGDIESPKGSSAFSSLEAGSLSSVLDLYSSSVANLNNSSTEMTFVSEEDFAVNDLSAISMPEISEHPAIIAKIAF